MSSGRQDENIIRQGQMNIRLMQQRGEQRDRNSLQHEQHEQQVADGGANFRGYLSGSDVSFKWCSANDVT